MNDSPEEHESGTITPAGRFARMEASLMRIEEKLDSKAEAAALLALEVRVQLVEDHGSSKANEALAIARGVQQHQQDIETGRAMSPVASAYLKQFNDMSADITDLKNKDAVRVASAEALRASVKETADVRYNALRTVVSVGTVIQSFLIILVTLLSVFKVI